MEKKFIELVNAHKEIVEKICHIYFYGNPYRDDYRQEILIRLWRAFPGFKGQSAFSTWMYRVALNASIDILRKQCLYPKHIRLSEQDLSVPDKHIEGGSENRDKLYSAIRRLSEAERAIILLYLEEYEYKEIAGIAGISENNVGVKINRIKNKLYTMLKDGKG